MTVDNIFSNKDITANNEQIAILKEHFPSCFDKNGKFLIESFKEIISNNEINTSSEGYSLNWLGKSYARLLANEKPRTLIRPNKEHNAKEQNKNSNNLLIKGDNIEVLKHLKNAYTGSVKVIYIDPPYNTGSDGFVYKDDRKFSREELSNLANISEEEAQRILDFTSKGSNSHSAWLTFIYPRLYIARELLSEYGFIFISIDENELYQLKMLCDDNVFGEENFVGQWNWFKSGTPPNLSKKIKRNIEYILCYQKQTNSIIFEGVQKTSKSDDPLTKPQNSFKELEFLPGTLNISMEDATIPAGIYGTEKFPNELLNDLIVENQTNKNAITFKNRFTWLQNKLKDELSNGTIINLSKNLVLSYKKATYAKEVPPNLIDEKVGVTTTENAGKALEQLFDGTSVFDYPKPVSLINYLLEFTDSRDSIILDFFAGSGTTAHAVMELNKDRGNRQYIMVQWPETLDSKTETGKNAIQYCLNNDLEPTIFSICKTRIEKAATKIKIENPDYEGDLGFKIFETIPLPEYYDSEIEKLTPATQGQLFDGSDIDNDTLEAILTTWTLYDRILLTTELDIFSLGDYKAYYGKGKESDTVYLMNKGFNINHVKLIIDKLENDKDFNPKKIVLYGHNFDTKSQRELIEALHSYQNKKSLEIDIIKRY